MFACPIAYLRHGRRYILFILPNGVEYQLIVSKLRTGDSFLVDPKNEELQDWFSRRLVVSLYFFIPIVMGLPY